MDEAISPSPVDDDEKAEKDDLEKAGGAHIINKEATYGVGGADEAELMREVDEVRLALVFGPDSHTRSAH